MKAIGLIFLIVFSWQYSVAQDALLAIVGDQERKLALSGVRPISDEKLAAVRDKIFSQLNLHRIPQKYKTLLSATWKNLSSGGRILSMDADAQFKLDIPKEFCHEQKCHKLVAAYLPFVDAIVISTEAPEDELYAWIYHELVHAFQYTYRLPLDVITLVESGFVNKTDIIDTLKYFYESQANYYTLKITEDPEWLEYGRSGWSLAPGSYGKAILSLFSFGQSLRVGNSFMNDYLPLIDNLGWRQGHLHTSRGEQLTFHELIVMRNFGWSFNPSVNFDLEFHTDYSHAIEQAYFGKIPYLLAQDGADQKFFKKMHDAYYEKVLSPLIDEPRCAIALDEVQKSAALVGWLNLPDNTLSSCSVYANFSLYRKEFLELYLSNKNRFFDKGGEGGHGPGLQISPHLYQPQLIIKPPTD